MGAEAKTQPFASSPDKDHSTVVVLLGIVNMTTESVLLLLPVKSYQKDMQPVLVASNV